MNSFGKIFTNIAENYFNLFSPLTDKAFNSGLMFAFRIYFSRDKHFNAIISRHIFNRIVRISGISQYFATCSKIWRELFEPVNIGSFSGSKKSTLFMGLSAGLFNRNRELDENMADQSSDPVFACKKASNYTPEFDLGHTVSIEPCTCTATK
jgi:hypothetical protein